MVLEEVASGTVGTGKTAVDEFMLSEFQTIAAAHFDLHGGLRQNFRFYLGLMAVPFTVFAVYKDATLQVYHLPTIMLLLLAIVPVLGFLMFLAMVNMRFDIILYTRACNAVRAYFKMRAADTHVGNFAHYLKLPTDKFVPSYFEGLARSYTWIFLMMAGLNAIYSFVAFKNLAALEELRFGGPWWFSIGFFLLHIVFYVGFGSWRNYREVQGVKRGS